MNIVDWFNQFLLDYTLRTVTLGAGLVGLLSGVLGAYAVLRRQSLLGDAISHATLPGVVLAFLLTRSKAPMVLLVGALAAGWLAMLWVLTITRHTRIKQDSALGLVLSVFFGLGMVLLTFTQRLPDARQAGLEQFLFGQAATLLERDVINMALISGAVILLVGLFWKEFKLLSFDRDFGHSLGFPMGVLDVLLTSLLVAAVVVGIQAVGVVLMSAMIVAPAVAARQWTNHLSRMVGLSALFGVIAGVSGVLVSNTTSGLSTGPTIVLSISFIVLVSVLFAPQRGVVVQQIKRWRSQSTIRDESVLSSLFTLAAHHEDVFHPHSLAAVKTMVAVPSGVQHSLNRLRAKGWVRQTTEQNWVLTPVGVEAAQRLLENERDE